MSWFSGININERVKINEGQSKQWSFTLNSSSPVHLHVEQVDGYGIDAYVMRAKEYKNFASGKVYHYISALSYENIGRFNSTEYLEAGSYYLVAKLPKIHDGRSSYGTAAIRCEVLE